MPSSAKDQSHRPKVAMDPNQGRKVRVVAKVRGSTGTEAELAAEDSRASWISVNKPNGEASETVTISFGGQSASRKESFEVDHCYEPNQDNDDIFSKEVKPLIAGVFDGYNATIVANGARGSGKTCLIQGSGEKPGIAALAMTEFLQMAEEKGKSISISFYEVCQDHAYDLLDLKRSAVLVLDDGKGNIKLKGLSQVQVRSMSEFYRYFSGSGSCELTQKIASQPPRRSHKGLMVHVSSPSESLDTENVGKMNFVDLAGYEDARRKSGDSLSFSEHRKINKSMYALLNVVFALNANESHVRYRESKLTHMLQDSLRGPSRILIVTCLNPYFCQDSIYMASLASRSCQRNSRTVLESMKRTNTSTRLVMLSSQKNHIPKTTSSTAKKKTTLQMHHSEKKAANTFAAIKGRKLFDEANHMTKSEKEVTPEATFDLVENALSTKDISIVQDPNFVENTMSNKNTDELAASINDSMAALCSVKEDEENKGLLDDHPDKGTPSIINCSVKALSCVEECKEALTTIMCYTKEKENKSALNHEEKSPPISARLRELSSNLKLLCSSTPLRVDISNKSNVSSPAVFHTDESSPIVSTHIVEPQTPFTEQSMRIVGREATSFNSPWETFNIRSSGMKTSLVEGYLKFLNTASKDDLKRLKGIGEKRATYILELRDESPEPFKSLDDLKDIGLSAKQIKGLMKKEVKELFN